MRGKRQGRVALLLVVTLAGGAGYLLRRSSRAAQLPIPAQAPCIHMASLPAPPREIPIDTPLPPLRLADDRGQTVALSSLRGAPMVLLFFRATSCPICRNQLTAFAKVAARFATAGIQVVAASPDRPAALAELRRDLNLPIRLLSDADEQAVNALCGGLAHCEILADAQGMVRWGAFSESWSHAPPPEALLAALRPESLAGAEQR